MVLTVKGTWKELLDKVVFTKEYDLAKDGNEK